MTKPAVREITLSLLNDFEDWTRTAPMFLTSPEGQAFAEEMRRVIGLAAEGLALRAPKQQSP